MKLFDQTIEQERLEFHANERRELAIAKKLITMGRELTGMATEFPQLLPLIREIESMADQFLVGHDLLMVRMNEQLPETD